MELSKARGAYVDPSLGRITAERWMDLWLATTGRRALSAAVERRSEGRELGDGLLVLVLAYCGAGTRSWLRDHIFRSGSFHPAGAEVGLASLTPHELRHTAVSLAVGRRKREGRQADARPCFGRGHPRRLLGPLQR